MKRLLLVSYAFPPLNVAGSFRPLRFVKYLSRFGWLTSVLTVRGRDDMLHDQSLLNELPASVIVRKAPEYDPFSLILQRKKQEHHGHSIKKIKRRLAERVHSVLTTVKWSISIPDIQIYWVVPAIIKGIQLCAKGEYDIIMTTSPPPSAHLIGLVLSRLFKKPWIADFRDPWVDSYYFRNRMCRLRQRLETMLEKTVITHAAAIITNTEPNRAVLLKRYGPVLPASKVVTITNGFDKQLLDSVKRKVKNKVTLCHTGILYPDLEPFFFLEAFAKWLNTVKECGIRDKVELLLAGSNNEGVRTRIKQLGLADCVRLLPRVSRSEALTHAKSADLLLVSLGFKQEMATTIPGKLYDYIGIKRPILGIFPKNSIAADLIRSTQTGYVIQSPDYRKILPVFDNVLDRSNNNSSRTLSAPNEVEIRKYESIVLTKQLATLCDNLVNK